MDSLRAVASMRAIAAHTGRWRKLLACRRSVQSPDVRQEISTVPLCIRRICTLLPLIVWTACAVSCASEPPSAESQSPETREVSGPLRVFLRVGPKTHGPGQHDHPRFLDEWRVLLEQRGAVVDGALAFPTAAQLDATDVLVLYAAEGASVAPDERARLERYLARGGGIVALHDAVCGDDPHWFKTIVGGAWEHGHSKWQEGHMGLYLSPEEHPITRGIPHFDLDDEIYYDLHLQPGVQVLGQSLRTVFDIDPQMWVYEKDAYRAFVSIQGHQHETFSHPAWQAIILRGIAWAAQRDADLLLGRGELETLRYPPGGPTRPELSHASFELHPDFEIALIANEPDVVNPIAIDWDDRGRVWVAATPGYPFKQASSGIPAHDQILVLEDGAGDGRLEPVSVFFEGLDLVTSLVVYDQGVIVTASPEILYLADTDGDLQADETTVLFRGFGFNDTHATISNMHWGLDGWIYATQGYSGNASRDIIGVDDVSHGPIGNGLFRFRPDGSAIELVSSYGSNTWGLDFAPDGELFFSMANGAHLRHVVLEESALAGGRVGGVNSWKTIHDHDRVYPIADKKGTDNEQIDFVGGFTAAAGCLLYDGGAWPDEFAGDHFVCEPTVNLVHRDTVVPDGVTFLASKPRQQEFLGSKDYWFRPVHLRTGPDGALYVLDFYNQAVIHNDTRGPAHGPTNAAVRPDRDRHHGRIWRVQHRDATPARGTITIGPALDDLLAALEHENEWRRTTATRLLRQRSDPACVPALSAMALRAERPASRIAALWLLDDLAAPKRAGMMVHAALRDPDAGVRANAARLSGRHGVTNNKLVYALMELVLDDSAPRARIRALEALAGAPLDALTLQALVALDARLEDDWSRSALMAALLPHAGPAIAAAARTGAQRVLVELVTQISRTRAQRLTDDVLVALAHNPIAAETLAAALTALEAGLGASFVPRANGSGLGALQGLLAHEDLDAATAALPLVGRWDKGGTLDAAVASLCERLLTRLRHPGSSHADALASLPALLSVPAFRSAAIEQSATLLRASVAPGVQLATIAALGGVADEGAGHVLCAALPFLGSKARDAAFEALLARAGSANALLDAVEREDVLPQLVGTRRAHRLRTHPDPLVSRRAGVLFARSTSTVEQRLAELLPLVSAFGDVVRGAEVFAEQCGTCHLNGASGTAIGPDLTGMGAHGIEQILSVILDPNAEIDPAYVNYIAESLDGVISTGILVRETAREIVLRNTEGDIELLRSDLAEFRSSGLSLMPEGLDAMGVEPLRDLLTYLTADYQGYRVLPLRDLTNAPSVKGLFDPERDWSGWGALQQYGVVDIDGIPFEVLDPAHVPHGRNVLVLRGGVQRDYACAVDAPLRVEVPVGRKVARVHVLGGVGGWASPFGGWSGEPVVRWTWRYADGIEESFDLLNGREFADWIGTHDVPGSVRVDGLVAPNAPGQIRRMAFTPGRDVPVDAIVLASHDSKIAPVFLGLTAELEGAPQRDTPTGPARIEADCFLLGGGSSHDFGRWFGQRDTGILATDGRRVHYTEDPAVLLSSLDADDVLVLSTNQPLSADVRATIEAHALAGGGLLFLHPGAWTNWPDWEAQTRLLRASTSSHEPLGDFQVEVHNGDHPVTAGLASTFEITDELYRAAPIDGAGPIEVLAAGYSPTTGARYPVVWTVSLDAARVVVITLGHDGRAHELPAFARLLSQAVAWLEGNR